MRRSKVLAKWRAGEFARFCSLGHVLPFYIRYAAHYRYDGIWLDLEHRNFDAREVQHLLALCQRFDIDCLIGRRRRSAPGSTAIWKMARPA